MDKKDMLLIYSGILLLLLSQSVVSDSVRPHRWQPTRLPGILQARTLEWVAISFSSTWKWKVEFKFLWLNIVNIFYDHNSIWFDISLKTFFICCWMSDFINCIHDPDPGRLKGTWFWWVNICLFQFIFTVHPCKVIQVYEQSYMRTFINILYSSTLPHIEI